MFTALNFSVILYRQCTSKLLNYLTAFQVVVCTIINTPRFLVTESVLILLFTLINTPKFLGTLKVNV